MDTHAFCLQGATQDTGGPQLLGEPCPRGTPPLGTGQRLWGISRRQGSESVTLPSGGLSVSLHELAATAKRVEEGCYIMEMDSFPVSEARSPRSGCQRFGSSLCLLEEATFSLCPHLDCWSLCVQMFSSCKDAGQIGSGLTPTASLTLNPSLKALVHRMSTEGKEEATGLGKDQWNRTDGQKLRELRTSQVG